MDQFSLEDDEYSGLFITQESCENNNDKGNKSDVEEDTFLGLDLADFQSPCSSFVKGQNSYQPQCSDISDDENVFGKEKNR